MKTEGFFYYYYFYFSSCMALNLFPAHRCVFLFFLTTQIEEVITVEKKIENKWWKEKSKKSLFKRR